MNNDVLVVGAGPVGLTAALALSMYDLPVTIIDKLDVRSEFSKALTLTPASLKLFAGLGVVDEMLACGKKIYGAEVYFEKRRACVINKSYLDGVYNYYLSIKQPDVERILEKALEEKGVKVRYQSTLKKIKQLDAVVKVSISSEENFAESFSYVLGCDGAHSLVRDLAGIKRTGQNYDCHFLLGDVELAPMPVLRGATYFIKSGSFIGLFPMNEKYTRLVLQRKGSDFDENHSIRDELQCALNEYLPEENVVIADMVWSSRARVLSRVAESNVADRIILAGDAFHLFSSVGGQTMNTGLQDAFDLAWRLSMIMKGVCHQVLLESYADERYIAVKKVLKLTDFYTNLLTNQDFLKEHRSRYLPEMRNRTYFKTSFAEEFSGLQTDYSTCSSGFVGKHIPYFLLKKGLRESSYELPVRRKYILFHLDFNTIPLSAGQGSVQAIALKPSEKASCLLGLSDGVFCLVTPGGYIAAHGNIDSIKRYMSNYFCETMIS